MMIDFIAILTMLTVLNLIVGVSIGIYSIRLGNELFQCRLAQLNTDKPATNKVKKWNQTT